MDTGCMNRGKGDIGQSDDIPIYCQLCYMASSLLYRIGYVTFLPEMAVIISVVLRLIYCYDE